MNSIVKIGAMIVAIGVASGYVSAQQEQHHSWREYGGGSDNSHYQAFDQVNKGNVGRLAVVWSYSTHDNNSYFFNPIIVDNVMYVLAKNNSLVALDATTGREIWIHAGLNGIAQRGINYWESRSGTDRRLIFQINNQLQELDAVTGKSILSFGDRGFVDLRQGLRRALKEVYQIQSGTPGQIVDNLIILGSATGEQFLAPPGDLRAFDIVSGRLVWQFHTVPHPGERGYDTWPKDAWQYAGGVNAWGEISVDTRREIAYFPLGSATYDFYGADRRGDDLFADCLLALDVHTGKYKWHFQEVHHDLWDYDAASAPQLITVRHEGRVIDAVAHAGKTGFLYVLDRSTGKPLWPIEERPVPKSEMPGEMAARTQPFPTLPPPFSRQRIGAEDVNPDLPVERRVAWQERISHDRNEGIFTPPGLSESVEVPGNRGGANWGTTASNPTRGIVYVLSIDAPAFLRMSRVAPYGRPNQPRPPIYGLFGPIVASGGAPAGQAARIHNNIGESPYGLMQGPPYPITISAPADRYFTAWNVMYDVIRAPWNTLTAYDLNKGIIKWKRPVGDQPGLMGEQRGMLVTSTGLIFRKHPINTRA